ncbi:MAG: hypothetical protein WC337_06515 [Candidatus Muiribacteriota bacterium]
MAFKFKCPVCQFDIVAKYLKIGDPVKCKNCGYESNVPEKAEFTDEDSNLIHKKENLLDIGNYNKITVTCENIEKPYTILETISFNISNIGPAASLFEELYNKLNYEINRVMEYNASSSEKNLNFQYSNIDFKTDFDKAAVIGLHELKKKACLIEGDAIIGLKQNYNVLPQNGLRYFHYNIYGTVVKYN